MTDSNYSTDPPVASAAALAAISDKISDIREEQEKLAEIPSMLSKMNMQLEQPTGLFIGEYYAAMDSQNRLCI